MRSFWSRNLTVSGELEIPAQRTRQLASSRDRRSQSAECTERDRRNSLRWLPTKFFRSLKIPGRLRTFNGAAHFQLGTSEISFYPTLRWFVQMVYTYRDQHGVNPLQSHVDVVSRSWQWVQPTGTPDRTMQSETNGLPQELQLMCVC